MGKYYSIDPETCSIEELKEAIEQCKEKAEFYDACQLGVKLFLNSVYGAMASSYYICNNLSIAESITLQGQDLIKYSMKVINLYFKNQWHLDTEVHLAIANKMLEQFPDFDKEEFMRMSAQPLQFGETLQCYGDSVTGDSLISTSIGEISIKELFDTYNIYSKAGADKMRVSAPDLSVKAYNIQTHETAFLPVKYIMRHYTNKKIYEVCCDGKSVKCTEDHSLISYNDNACSIIYPSDIVTGDTKVITLKKSGDCEIDKIIDVKDVSSEGEYVYDICVDSDDENWHTFFANGILVHNTDSVSKNSIIYTENHPQGITIEDLYNEGSEDAGTTLKGHESKKLNDRVLNFNDSLYYGEVERIIRHKVSKPMWKLKTESGKEIICTEDHSLIVFRNGEKIKVKPSEILSDDQVLCVE